jgi:hypothetical protein
MAMGFWLGIAAAQNAAASAKPADRRHRVLSIVGGIVITLLIGGGLVVMAVLTSWQSGRYVQALEAFADLPTFAPGTGRFL